MKTVKVTKCVEEMVSHTIRKEVEMYVASDGTLHDSESEAIDYERYELCDKWRNVAEEFLKHEVVLYNTREEECCYLIHLANEDEYEKLCNALDYGEDIDIGCLRLPHSFPVNRIMWIEWDALNCGWADDEDGAKDWLRWQIQDMEECIGGLKRILNELNNSTKSAEINYEALAKDIYNWCIEHELWDDNTIYFNGKAWSNLPTWGIDEGKKIDEELYAYENRNPRHFFEYANPDTLSMSFEGGLNHVLNDYNDNCLPLIEEFKELFHKYGLYYELGHSWNLSAAKE